jgi:hypothetical protein
LLWIKIGFRRYALADPNGSRQGARRIITKKPDFGGIRHCVGRSAFVTALGDSDLL